MDFFEILKHVGAAIVTMGLVIAANYRKNKTAFSWSDQIPFLITAAILTIVIIVTKNSPIWNYMQVALFVLFSGYAANWVQDMQEKQNPTFQSAYGQVQKKRFGWKEFLILVQIPSGFISWYLSEQVNSVGWATFWEVMTYAFFAGFLLSAWLISRRRG